jgi:RNA polymerase sigma-70 factor (ECF subfamily)
LGLYHLSESSKDLPFLKNISTPALSDLELVNLYKQSGDLKVLGDLYQRYMDLVYASCLRYLRDPEISKDAVMAIFEELVVKLKKHDVENFRGWLHTLSKNHCLMKIRSSKHLKTNEFDPDRMQLTEEVHLNGMMEKEQHLNQMAKCLEILPAEQKIAVELFYLQNKCYREISELTGLEWNKVRSHIQNGRRNLKMCLEKQTVQF